MLIHHKSGKPTYLSKTVRTLNSLSSLKKKVETLAYKKTNLCGAEIINPLFGSIGTETVTEEMLSLSSHQ